MKPKVKSGINLKYLHMKYFYFRSTCHGNFYFLFIIKSYKKLEKYVRKISIVLFGDLIICKFLNC